MSWRLLQNINSTHLTYIRYFDYCTILIEKQFGKAVIRMHPNLIQKYEKGDKFVP